MASGCIASWQIEGDKVEAGAGFIFLGSRITAEGDWSHEVKRHLLLGRKATTNLENIVKSRDIPLPAKTWIVKAMVFPVVMYRCWPKRRLSAEELMLSNCGVGEDSWGSLDSKEMQPVSPKGNQLWIFIGRTDVEAEAPILWPPDAKSWPVRKDPDARKDWGQEEKGTTEDEMVGWHHWLNGHEFEQTLGDSEGRYRILSG